MDFFLYSVVFYIVRINTSCPYDFHICIDRNSEMGNNRQLITNFAYDFYQKALLSTGCLYTNNNFLILPNIEPSRTLYYIFNYLSQLTNYLEPLNYQYQLKIYKLIKKIRDYVSYCLDESKDLRMKKKSLLFIITANKITDEHKEKLEELKKNGYLIQMASFNIYLLLL